VNSGLAPNAVAKHNSARRGRSRKRRPSPAGARTPAKPPVSQGAAGSARERKQSPAADERPQAPWHPLPLSELLILVGAVAVVVGLSRSSKGFAAGGPTLLAGIGAAMIGTIEVTLREHRGGYRSHALLLAVLPVIVFHSAVILIVAAFTVVPRALSIGILPLDLALFAVLFKFLRARYVDARRERNFATRR
jgi:hypothetical protein